MANHDEFLKRCERYLAASGLAPATLSTRVLGNGQRYALLAAGKLNIGIQTLAEASDRLAALEAQLAARPADEDWAKPALTGKAA